MSMLLSVPSIDHM